MSESPAIYAEQLTRRFGRNEVINGVNLEVQRGEIFGFLGPNGAGKTTTILMLTGILRQTSGELMVLGQKMSEWSLGVKSRIGVVAEHQALYGDMSAQQYLHFFAELYAMSNTKAFKRIEELLEALDLANERHKRVKEFSRGMQQKLSVARALLHEPELLIMDEPASGLDPYGISQVRALIREHKQQGNTIFISSHIISEIEQISDRVAIIDNGRVVAKGGIDDIRNRLKSDAKFVVEFEGDEDSVWQALHHLPFVSNVIKEDYKFVLSVSSIKDPRGDISRAITAADAVVLNIMREVMSLEEAFLIITDEKMQRITDLRSETSSFLVDATENQVHEKNIRNVGYEFNRANSDHPSNKNRATDFHWRVASMLRIFRRSIAGTLNGLSIYIMMSVTCLVAAVIIKSHIDYIAESGTLVLSDPMRGPLLFAILAMTVFTGISSTATMATEKERGTLEVLFYGPLDSIAYIFSKMIEQLLLFGSAMTVLAVYLWGASRLTGMVFTVETIGILVVSIVPAASMVALGLLMATLTSRVRSAIALTLVVVIIFIGINVGNQIAAIQPRDSLLGSASEIVATLSSATGWLSPFSYLQRMIENFSLGGTLAMTKVLVASFFYCGILIGLTIFSLHLVGVQRWRE